MILQAIDELLRSPSIAAITPRVHVNVLPQSVTLPAITYYRISGVSFEGLVNNSRMAQARFQIDCFADTVAQSDQLGEAVRLVLQKFQGDVSGQWIQEISLADGPSDEMDPVSAGSNARRYYQSQDFFVFYQPQV